MASGMKQQTGRSSGIVRSSIKTLSAGTLHAFQPRLFRRRNGHGTVYLAMLFAVAFLGVALAAGAQLWSIERQRQKEAQLLQIGLEFSQAIESYYLSSPGSVKVYPQRIEDLLLDDRFLFVKRHLRQIYVDPITGKRDWRLVMSPLGGIQGVASTSEAMPIKTANFDDRFSEFAGKKKYAQWVFGYAGP